MTTIRRHLRLSWIALAAIAGMFSAAGAASASTTGADAQGPGRACCVGRVCAKCCCPPASAAADPARVERSATFAPVGSRLATPAPLCECRPAGPEAPGSKSEPRPAETRDDQIRSQATELTIETRPAVSTVRLVLSPADPPKSPLYLRTSRLLI